MFGIIKGTHYLAQKTTDMSEVNKTLTWREAERICEVSFQNNGPFWHLPTDGNNQEIIFTNRADFVAAMNALAISFALFPAKLISFELMHNHVHLILSGPKDDCVAVFMEFKRRLERHFTKCGRFGVLSNFCYELIPIESLRQMRTEIAYVHRNAFVASHDCLVYTYEWGSGMYYYHEVLKSIHFQPFAKIPYLRKREIFQGRVLNMPDGYSFNGEYVFPPCFLDLKLGESFYNSPSEYFIKLTKNLEDQGAIAERMKDKAIVNYEEGFNIAQSLSWTLFQTRVSLLTLDQKTELSRRLHFNYMLSNKHISTILKMNMAYLDELFPEKR